MRGSSGKNGTTGPNRDNEPPGAECRGLFRGPWWELRILQVLVFTDGGVGQGLGGGVRPAGLVSPRTRQVVDARERQRGSKCCPPKLQLPPRSETGNDSTQEDKPEIRLAGGKGKNPSYPGGSTGNPS